MSKKIVKMKKKSVSFDDHFSKVYGKRWNSLQTALLSAESRHVVLLNKYFDGNAVPEGVPQEEETLGGLRILNVPKGIMYPQPVKDKKGVVGYYLFDYASAFIASLLNVAPCDRVLDLCASPGGKAVALAQLLGSQGELVCNEINTERYFRLQRTMSDFIAEGQLNVKLSQKDGTRFYYPGYFDKVLLDAPCSSERHLMQQAEGSAQWNYSLTVECASAQQSLLAAACEAVKVGGFVLYSTCSISPLENDDVIEQVLRRSRCAMLISAVNCTVGEPTKYGVMILPDVCQGAGPMYCCLLKKESDTRNDPSSSDSDSETQ